MAERTCTIPHANPVEYDLWKIYLENNSIAIVGLSDDPDKPSNDVAQYLIGKGFRVIPVNPRYETVLGQKCYPDLRSIPGEVDIVDIFRNNEAIPAIVDEAISIKPRVIWMQLGLRNDEAAQKACKAGITVVQDLCMKAEHERLASMRT